MEETKKTKKMKKPTWLGLSVYIAVIVVLGLAALFAPQLARLVKGPILCIYVGVLPKYILGLAFILAGIDGIAYGVRIYRDIDWLGTAASGLQSVLLVIFLFLIFPLSLKEGVPPGSTYNLMRLMIGLMLVFIAWDLVSETRGLIKGRKSNTKESLKDEIE
jgi:hypothetical protein